MKILKAGILYFVVVFGVGFVLGPIRVLWVVPRVGVRIAELMEFPIMLVVIIIVTRWLVIQLAMPPKRSSRLGMGFCGCTPSGGGTCPGGPDARILDQ